MTFLTVSRETALGARVVETLGSAMDSVQLHIVGSAVAVRAGQAAMAPDSSVAKRIRRVQGVSTVMTRPPQ